MTAHPVHPVQRMRCAHATGFAVACYQKVFDHRGGDFRIMAINMLAHDARYLVAEGRPHPAHGRVRVRA